MRRVRLLPLDESTYFQLSSPPSPPPPFVSHLQIRTFPSLYPPFSPADIRNPVSFGKEDYFLLAVPVLMTRAGI